MCNLLRMEEILTVRGADDARSGWLREDTRGCEGRKGRNGDTVTRTLNKNSASITICQVRNKGCGLNGLRAGSGERATTKQENTMSPPFGTPTPQGHPH